MVDGVFGRSFAGESLMLVLVQLDARAFVPNHQHPQEQAGIVLDGELEFSIGGKVKKLMKGDIYFIPPNIEHSVVDGDRPCQVLDIFTPLREDLL